MQPPRVLALLAPLALALAVLSPTPAAADEVGIPSVSDFTLTMYDADSDLVPPPVLSQVRLQCTPDVGTHPTPGEACDSLRAVDGRFDRLPRIPNTFCYTLWAPVTVTVAGNWRGEPVEFEETYSNDCVAAVSSDNVFRF